MERQRRFDAVVHETVADFDAHQDASLDGAASSAAWMRANLRLTPGAGRAQVRRARRVRELPAMEAAFQAGEISAAHVNVVTDAMARTPERRATVIEAEATFAEAARKLDPAQLAMVVRRWAHTVDPAAGVRDEQSVHAQRFLSVSRTFQGAVAINGLLAPEAGAVVMTALEAMSTASYRAASEAGARPGVDDDPRPTAGQRRADSLTRLARLYLDGGLAPEIGGVRPHLTVTVAAESLNAAPARLGWLLLSSMASVRSASRRPAGWLVMRR